MNQRNYTPQTLTDYLLGSLPDPEAEHFDELSFTDTEFADELKSVENNLIDSYIHDELSAATRQRFETYYLQTPLRREKVEFAKDVQSIAARNLDSPPNEILAKAEANSDGSTAGFFSAINIFASLRPILRWGFAAAGLILIISIGFWVIKNSLRQNENEMQAKQENPAQSQSNQQTSPANSNLSGQNEIARIAPTNPQPEAPAQKESPKLPPHSEKSLINRPTVSPQASIASFILMPSLRDADQVKSLVIPKPTTRVAIRLQLESDDYPDYRVTLTNQLTGKTLWLSGKIKATSKGTGQALNISFPADLLGSQIYSLNVTAINPQGESEIISNYPFRAVLK